MQAGPDCQWDVDHSYRWYFGLHLSVKSNLYLTSNFYMQATHPQHNGPSYIGPTLHSLPWYTLKRTTTPVLTF